MGNSQYSLNQLLMHEGSDSSESHQKEAGKASLQTTAAGDKVSTTMFLVRCFEEIHVLPYINESLSPVQKYSHSPHWHNLLDVFAACGAAVLSEKDLRWIKVSLEYYSHAIRALHDYISSTDAAHSDECILAVINTLHIFEVTTRLD